VSARRSSLPNALMLLLLTVGGMALWILHAGAWDLGRRSPILDYEGAQSAVAAREVAHGRWQTNFALPIALAFHPTPPWPVVGVPPGLVLVEAGILRLLPDERDSHGKHRGRFARPDQQEGPLLLIAIVAFLMIAVSLGLATRHLMAARTASGGAVEHTGAARPLTGTAAEWRVAAAGFALGLTFLLDPEAQHLAMGPAADLPFTFGLIGALAALALDHAGRRPFLYGLLLGLTGSFGGAMLAFAPILAVAAALTAPSGRRVRALFLVLLGFALPLAPTWIVEWRAFGSPIWDPAHDLVWDGVQGRTAFSLLHLPALPDVPVGASALSLLAAKVLHNLPGLVLATMTGPRALWVAALIAWTLIARPPHSQRVAGWTVIAIGAASLIGAGATVPLLRSVFPARILTESAGILACWGLVVFAAEVGARPPMRRTAGIFVALLAVGWGVLQTTQGLAEARATAKDRGTPSVLTLLQISVLMTRELQPGEPVMSNLGPELAWHARRPVIHLALRPEDLAACRRKTEFRDVLLVFRDPSRAWPGWQELVAHPVEASRDASLGITRARQFRSPDGFIIAWLELAPPAPKLAAARAAGWMARAESAIPDRSRPQN